MLNKIFKLLSIIGFLFLSSCFVLDTAFNQIGFNVKNPVYNDSNAANSKYNRSTMFSALDRRTPDGNKQFLALSSGEYHHYKVQSQDFKKYDSTAGIKKHDFWKKVYGKNMKVEKAPIVDSTPHMHYPDDDDVDNNPVLSVSPKEVKLKNTKIYAEPSGSWKEPEVGDVVVESQSEEQVLKTIEFIDHKK